MQNPDDEAAAAAAASAAAVAVTAADRRIEFVVLARFALR